MTEFADLHTHTTFSDGILSPTDLVRLAAERGLKAIAITDHDTVAGVGEACAEGKKIGVEVIPGIELSCTEGGKEYHILGYYIDITSPLLLRHQEYCTEQRRARIISMVKKLNGVHIPLTLEEVYAKAGQAAPARPHVADALVAGGYCETAMKAFNTLIGDGRPAAVGKWHFPTAEGIDLIHRCGGVAVLAHPGKHTPTKAVAKMVIAGLDGIETRHPGHSAFTVLNYARIASSHQLCSTGGSDYHGSRPFDDTNFGKIRIPYDEVELLYSRVKSRREVAAMPLSKPA